VKRFFGFEVIFECCIRPAVAADVVVAVAVALKFGRSYLRLQLLVAEIAAELGVAGSDLIDSTKPVIARHCYCCFDYLIFAF
jgi:hypothetical protein